MASVLSLRQHGIESVRSPCTRLGYACRWFRPEDEKDQEEEVFMHQVVVRLTLRVYASAHASALDLDARLLLKLPPHERLVTRL